MNIRKYRNKNSIHLIYNIYLFNREKKCIIIKLFLFLIFLIFLRAFLIIKQTNRYKKQKQKIESIQYKEKSRIYKN